MPPAGRARARPCSVTASLLAVFFFVAGFFVTTTFAFTLFAAAFAFLFAAGEGYYVEDLGGLIRVVTLDDEFAALGVATGPVLDDYAQATARTDCCRERVVDEFEVAASAAESGQSPTLHRETVF